MSNRVIEEEKKESNLMKATSPTDRDSDCLSSYEEITPQEREIMDYLNAKKILLVQPKDKAQEFIQSRRSPILSVR